MINNIIDDHQNEEKAIFGGKLPGAGNLANLTAQPMSQATTEAINKKLSEADMSVKKHDALRNLITANPDAIESHLDEFLKVDK